MKKVALVFPGQGSHYVGMGKSLCEKFLIANDTFEEANSVLGFDLKKLCFEGDIKELTKTENTQPAILTTSIAAFRVYMKEVGCEPSFMAGHSLGEISALTSSGAIAFSDALKIVRKRGQLMQAAVAPGVGAMSAVSGVDIKTIVKECEKFSVDGSVAAVANYNSPSQIVISGHKSAISAVEESLKSIGASVIALNVSTPFHCELMRPAAEGLREELNRYSYNSLKYPVISNVTALPYEDSSKIVENLTMQLFSQVHWMETMELIKNKGIDTVIEIGPQKVLKNLSKRNIKDINAFSYDIDEDVQAVKEILNSSKDKEEKGIDFISRCLAIAVCTKNTNWNNDEYRRGVIEPYRKIKQMNGELEKEGKKPTAEQMKEALDMLCTVFSTKRAPLEEQSERINQIFNDTSVEPAQINFVMPCIQ